MGGLPVHAGTGFSRAHASLVSFTRLCVGVPLMC